MTEQRPTPHATEDVLVRLHQFITAEIDDLTKMVELTGEPYYCGMIHAYRQVLMRMQEPSGEPLQDVDFEEKWHAFLGPEFCEKHPEEI